MDLNKYQNVKMFLEKTGMTIDEATEFLDWMEKQEPKKEVNENKIDALALVAKRWKEEKNKYDNMTFEQLYQIMIDRGIL